MTLATHVKTKLTSLRVVDESKLDNSKVGILSKVEVMNLKMKKQMNFTIVSEAEANLKEGKISSTSPIGKALMGKVPGERTTAITPGGEIEFEVLKISI